MVTQGGDSFPNPPSPRQPQESGVGDTGDTDESSFRLCLQWMENSRSIQAHQLSPQELIGYAHQTPENKSVSG